MLTQILFTSPNPAIDIPETSLHDLILSGARSRPKALALVDATTS